jgi:hypothetical protein
MSSDKPFKFKTRRARPIKVETYAPPRPAKVEEEIGLIQGMTPDSKEEWWVSQWLDRKHLQYAYQYRVFGGGPEYFYNLDFLVYTRPLATMLEPLGNHWHTDQLGQDDRKRQLEIEDVMRDIAKIPIQFITVDEMINRESVEAALERIFHET